MPPKPTQTPAQEPKQKSLDIFDVNTNLDQVKIFFSKLSDDQKQIELNKIKRKIEKLVEQANKEEGNGQSTQKLIALNKQGTVLFLTEVVKNLPKRVVEITPPTPITSLIQSLKQTSNLDSTFEGMDYHSIEMITQTHQEALTRYENSGDKTWIWDNLKREMPYTPQSPKSLDVLALQFPDPFKRTSENIVKWMQDNKLRPLTYEEHLEYITTHPEHQKKSYLLSLGTKHMLDGDLRVPYARWGVSDRRLGAGRWSSGWDASYRFLAAPISS